jgi:hypothetical protein
VQRICAGNFKCGDLKPLSIEAIMEGSQGLEVELAKEKKQVIAEWARQEKHIKKVMENYERAAWGGERDWRTAFAIFCFSTTPFASWNIDIPAIWRNSSIIV